MRKTLINNLQINFAFSVLLLILLTIASYFSLENLLTSSENLDQTTLIILMTGFSAILILAIFYARMAKSIEEKFKLRERLKKEERDTLKRIAEINALTLQISSGDYLVRLNENTEDEIGKLSKSLNGLANQLQTSFEKLLDNEWLQRSILSLSATMEGEKNTGQLCEDILIKLIELTAADAGAFYTIGEHHLVRKAMVGLDSAAAEIPIGHGIAGASAKGNREIWIKDISREQISIQSASAHITPTHLIALPVRYDGIPIGVIELLSINGITDREFELLNEVAGNIGIAVKSAENRNRLVSLLFEGQNHKKELEVQTEELRSQAEELRTLAEEMSVQSEHLQNLNKELQLQKDKEMLARREAEKASKATSNFLAVMSHEIRTPMNGVIGMAALLAETELTAEQKEYVEIINTSGNALIDIINDILDFSKIDSDNMYIENQDFNLVKCAEEVIDLFSAKAVDQGLELVLNIAPEVPEIFNGDSLRIRQVLINFINNALKFTSKGEVCLKLTIDRSNPDVHYLAFEVTDTGIGIADEKLNDLFKAFSQLDSSTTRKYGGTGLGLAISKKLITLMKGEVSVKSKLGKGTTFRFLLPYRFSEDPREEVMNFSRTINAEGKKALIIEESLNTGMVLKTMLERQGMSVHLSTSEDDAAAFVSTASELHMLFIGNQTDFTRDLAENAKKLSNELAIIVLLRIGERLDEKIKADIAPLTLRRPLKLAAVLSLVRTVFDAPALIEPGNNRSIAPSRPERRPYSEINILLADDNMINVKLAVRMLEKIGYSPDVAYNGKVAIQMMKQKRYDLVLMDILMPEMDGLEATREIRASFEHQPKIIAMTANIMEEDRNACKQAGMDGFIAKPFKIEELLSALDRAIMSIDYPTYFLKDA